MRIIGGEHRSRLIEIPKGVATRPTQDKVRQAVFNILGDVSGKAVLDLFAGSGAFGIEAVSRGASRATFVENNIKCLQVIKRNLDSLKIGMERYGIIRSDALGAPCKLAESGARFDIIFMDPPYYRDMAKNCLINIDSCDILPQFAMVVVEHHRKDGLPTGLKRLVLYKERKYGDTLITIYKGYVKQSPGSSSGTPQ